MGGLDILFFPFTPDAQEPGDALRDEPEFLKEPVDPSESLIHQRPAVSLHFAPLHNGFVWSR